MNLGWVLLGLWVQVSAFASAPTATTLTGWGEQAEVDRRIQRFYRNPQDPTAMNHRQPKYDVASGSPVELNESLKQTHPAPPLTLAWLAQKKGESQFNLAYEKFIAKHFPQLANRKPTWAAIESNDRVETLTKGWLNTVTYDLDSIPSSAQTGLKLWSDYYWPVKFGLTSYRYGKYVMPPFKTYQEAVGSYQQPQDWGNLLLANPNLMAFQMGEFSPAEKYDLTVGDEQFSLTKEQKLEGSKVLDPTGNVEEWMGICHGWTAATIMSQKPVNPVTLVGARGATVPWYPSDVRAMATLAWANGEYPTNAVSGRCDAKTVETYPNGRIKAQDCFDTNPSTFHLALGNMIGRAHASFVMDKAYDYEVWNQPISAYEFTYFNPLNPTRRSKNWREVAVPYDAAFKLSDRFQNPLTRGARTPTGYSDRNVKYIVGVVATVVYAVEVFPTHGTEPSFDRLARETYTYDLELYQYGNKLFPQGGEWHENAHPDFLWVPARNSSANLTYDRQAGAFSGRGIPPVTFSNVARQASGSGYPLCEVMRVLVNAASGTHSYHCGS